jgi:signal transduction histidine kinase
LSTEVQRIDLDTVLAHMPTALVVMRVGAGDIIYANDAARALGFAYGEEGWTVADTNGAAVAHERLPHLRARHGESFEGQVYVFEHGERKHALRFHCHAMPGGLCVLTFDDVTELRDAVKSRDELVSMAAHELRSPLGALYLVAERLARRALELPDAHGDLKKMADSAIRQIRRLNILVSNLLDVSRIRAGRFTLDCEPLALGDVIREACEPLYEQAQQQGKPLVLSLHDPAYGQWDRSRMEQVVTNLVTNAIKYGGSPVTIELRRMDHHVELVVSDAGPGISPDQQARIWRPFERASSRHTAQSLGLGLFIVKEIVAAHGGSIELDSRPGRTTFTLTLPLRT